jgi:hypothetical protein
MNPRKPGQSEGAFDLATIFIQFMMLMSILFLLVEAGHAQAMERPGGGVSESGFHVRIEVR